VVDLRDGEAVPDGMILTPDGQSVIVAMYHPGSGIAVGEARQYHIDSGKLEAVWKTPGSPRVTCPQLVEFDGRIKLILTTAVEDMPADQRARNNNAGCIFIADTLFEGLPEQPVFELPQ
jgi:sugar lactone lactonase YvrE